MIIMFGRNKPATHPVTSKFLEDQEKPHFMMAPKPDDSNLPTVPDTRTWYVREYDRSNDHYVSNDVHLSPNWLTFSVITGYKWIYNDYSNAWCVQVEKEMVARIRTDRVVGYGLVRP